MTNNRVTLAKVEQKLEDHIIQQDKDIIEIKGKIDNMAEGIGEIKQILVKGDGKIKRDHTLITEHISSHKYWIGIMITLFAIFVSVVVAVIN